MGRNPIKSLVQTLLHDSATSTPTLGERMLIAGAAFCGALGGAAAFYDIVHGDPNMAFVINALTIKDQ